nr:MAG TPA: hypothetical protein [Microviridae sp.]
MPRGDASFFSSLLSSLLYIIAIMFQFATNGLMQSNLLVSIVSMTYAASAGRKDLCVLKLAETQAVNMLVNTWESRTVKY